MKKIILPVALLTLMACGNQTQEQTHEQAASTEQTAETGSVKNVGPDEFKKLVEQNNGIVLDVRTPEEVAQGVIPGATTIDFYAPDFDQKIQELDKSKPVYVYCKSGGRSSNAAQKLKDLGYQVYNLNGGITAWQAQGFDVEK